MAPPSRQVDRTCLTCGTPFRTTRSRVKDGRGKYCSKECKHQAPSKKVQRKCPRCGRAFEVQPSRMKYGRGKFCSAKCKNEGFPKRSKKIKLKCPVCQKEFERYSAQKMSEWQFCSRTCAYKGRSVGLVKRIVTKPYNIKQVEKCKKKCTECRALFIPTSKTQKYCSRKCFEDAHREHMQGANNPSYIDGRSYDKRCYRGSDWDHIRMLVYRRDRYQCQICKKRCQKREIQAHHIQKYKDSQDNSLKNLVTLCNKHHAEVELDPEALFHKRPDLRPSN